MPFLKEYKQYESFKPDPHSLVPAEVTTYLIGRGWTAIDGGWQLTEGLNAGETFLWTEALSYEMFRMLMCLEDDNGN